MANRGRIRAAEGIGGRVKFLPLAWAGMPKQAFAKIATKERRKRNASGALCDDPRIAVGPGVLTELQRERKRSQQARQSDTASSHLGSRDARRTGGELCIVANRGRIRAAEGIGGRVRFLPLAWAGMPKTSFRKNSDSLLFSIVRCSR